MFLKSNWTILMLESYSSTATLLKNEIWENSKHTKNNDIFCSKYLEDNFWTFRSRGGLKILKSMCKIKLNVGWQKTIKKNLDSESLESKEI